MTIEEYVVDLIDEHWNKCSFDDAKRHSLITLKRVKIEANSILESWFNESKLLIEKINVIDFTDIKEIMNEKTRT